MRTFTDTLTDSIVRESRESGNEVVARVNERDVTRKQLTAAFNLVAPRDNWKRPIDATIEAAFDEIDLVPAAVTFFTASVATVECIEPVANRTDGRGKYRVTAAGYYATCGA